MKRSILHVGDEVGLGELVQADRDEPRTQQRASVRRGEVADGRALAAVAVAQHALGDLEHAHSLELRPLAVVPERADGERHRRVRPLLGAALLAAGRDPAGADVLEELLGARRGRRDREGAADVDAGVVVAAADRDPALRLRRRSTAGMFSSGAREPLRVSQIGKSSARRRRWRLLSGAATAKNGCASALTMRLASRYSAHASTSPAWAASHSWSSGVIPKQSTWTACGSPWKRAVSSSEMNVSGSSAIVERAVDRVVVGDRHEVHAAELCQLVDLLRRRRALGQAERPLDPQSRHRRGARVAVQIDSGRHRPSLLTLSLFP